MINYRIVVDSCGEFTEDMKKNPHFAHAALHLSIDGEQFVDDETFDRLDFLAKMKESPNCPKSSCPSPEVYRAAFDCGAEHLYAITLSAELSGSYNSAVLGMNLFLENHPDAKVHVFNSCSASVGETLRRSLSTKRRVLILKQLLRRWMTSSFICIRILCWRAWIT